MEEFMNAMTHPTKERHEFFLSFNTTISLAFLFIICLAMEKYSTVINMKEIDNIIEKITDKYDSLFNKKDEEVVEGYCDLFMLEEGMLKPQAILMSV
jgi:hypothetical protein